MTPTQLNAARKALSPYTDRMKLERTTDGAETRLTPYLIADPEVRGTPVVIVRGVTADRDIGLMLSRSIQAVIA